MFNRKGTFLVQSFALSSKIGQNWTKKELVGRKKQQYMKTTWQKDGFTICLAQASDVEDYYFQNYCSLDKEVDRLTGCKEHFTKGEVTFFSKSDRRNRQILLFILDLAGKIIGDSVINEIDWDLCRANFRICIFHPAERGKGIGSWAVEVSRDFAFDQLHRLELDVFSFNPRAEKAYLRAGFKREGVLRDAVFDRGQYADDIIMAILGDDWLKLKES